MSSDTRIREAVQDSLQQFTEQQAAALEVLVDTLIQTAVAESEAETAEVRAEAETAAQQMLEERLALAQSEANASLAAALEAASAEADASLAATLAEARAETEAAVAGMVNQARAEAVTMRAEVERLQGEVERARSELQQSQAESVKARADADKARHEIAGVRVDAEKAAAAAKSAQTKVSETQGGLALGRMLEAIRALDGAQALTDVFDGLTDMAAREADRAAVLLVRGSQLRVWRFAGFEGAPDPRTVGLKLDGAGVVAEAVRTKQPKTAGPESSAFSFAPLPTGRTGVVVPIEVGGQVVAVLYADNAMRPDAMAGGWREGAEILARHAARCLEALTVQHSTAAAKPAGAGQPAPVAVG